MPNLTLKNIPEELYNALKVMAEENYRSVTGEVFYLIEQAIKKKEKQAEVLAHARRLREITAHYYLTEEEITKWKNEGRP